MNTDTGQVLLIEAKAHIPEMASGGTKAGDESLEKIDDAFKEFRKAIARRSTATWTSTFYQHANRLAFLYLLRANEIDAHLLHILFLSTRDVGGPRSADEWRRAMQMMMAALGALEAPSAAVLPRDLIDAADFPSLRAAAGRSIMRRNRNGCRLTE